MVSEHQFADELQEVGDNPEEEVNPFGSAACPSDHVGLDPKTRVDSRELAGNNGWNSQKDRQFDLLLQAIDERIDSHFRLSRREWMS